MTVVTATPSLSNPLFLAYVGAFSLATVACLVSVPRLDGIDDRDTRHGLRWLLLLSAGWAGSHVAFLLAPTRPAKIVAYSLGLVFGIAAVGAWLYFTSAFTSRTYHRNPTYRRLAVAVFLGLVAVKLTNPIHGEYYQLVEATAPFPYLAVENGTLHWLSMGLAYSLSFVGYFMLVELFTEVDLDTKPILGLLVVTGLPIALDIVGYATPLLIDITYEPLGVAVFAVSVAFVYTERIDELQLAAERDVPIVALDTQGNVRDTNRTARARFPALASGRGQPLEAVLPAAADRLDDDAPILEVEENGHTTYYRITESPFGTARAGLGRTIVFTDITERERYRRELERQNDRLETFASMISHDLRNPLNVAQGQFQVIEDALDAASSDPSDAAGSTDVVGETGDGDPVSAERSNGDVGEIVDGDSAAIATAIDDVDASLERMGELIDEILTLARSGQTVEDAEPILLAELASDCWEMIAHDDATIACNEDLTIRGDRERLKRLFENLFRNAIEHGGDDVTITIDALPDDRGFYVADDGPGIPADDRDDVFEAGFTTNAEGTGFGLAIVQEVVDAHDWTVTVTESDDGGARFEFSSVDVLEPTQW
jgi:signal transduction histidine kinase